MAIALLSYGLLSGQDCEPTPPAANTNDCNINPVRLALAAEGNNIFCDGQAAIVAIDEERSIDFDQLIYYWCDGAVDTIGFDEQPGTHIYNIPEDIPCSLREDNYFIRVIGQKFCDAGVTERSTGISVGVRYRPTASFTTGGVICLMDGVSPTNNSCRADQYQWDFGDGTMSTLENPSHVYDTAGIYTITLRVSNDCGTDTQVQSVSVVQEPEANFDQSAPDGCVSDIIDFSTNVNPFTNTRWTILPNDTLAWCYTDTATMDDFADDISVLFKQVGTYTIRLSGSNACAQTEEAVTVDIREAPVFSLQALPTNCGPLTLDAADLDFQITGEFTSVNWTFVGADRSTATGEDFGEVTFTQSGSITVSVASDCNPAGTQRNIAVTIEEPQTVSITQPDELCASADTVQLVAVPAGGTWSGSGITPSGRFVPSTPGTRNFTYALGNTPCNDAASVDVVINDAPLAQLQAPSPACDETSITAADLGFSISGEYTNLSWTFTNGTPATASGEDIGTIVFSQSGTVSLLVSSECGDETLTAEVMVTNSESVSIDPIGVLCAGSSDVQLTSSPPGGTWSGTAVSSSGLFSPATAGAGNYTLIYRLNNAPCNDQETIDIEVVNSATVTAQDETLCIDSEEITLTVSPAGGTWSGRGITDSVTGTFDPSLAGVGIHQPSYSFTDANACLVIATPTITVEALPVLTAPDNLEVCQTNEDISLPDLSNIMADPPGGSFSWSGPGTQADGTFNSATANLPEGTYTVTYTYTRNDCTVSDSMTITVTIPEPLTVDGPQEICIAEGQLRLMTNLGSGRWSGPGIDATTGVIDLEAAGGGTFTYLYVTAQGTSCVQEASLELEIKDPAIGLTAGGPETFCEGPATFLLQGASPPGGIWSGPALLDPSTGRIDLTQLATGLDYTYTYCVTDAAIADCEACQNKTLTYSAKPSANFSITGPTCIDESFQVSPAVSGLAYQWDFGDGTTSTSATPTHAYTSRGTYTLQLIVSTGDDCQDTTRQTLFISEPPTANFSLPNNEGCAPFSLALNDLSAGDNISVRYVIEGDTLLTPTYVFDSIFTDQWFTITQLVENDCGMRSTVDSVLVHPYPFARFGLDTDEGCSPYTSDLINVTLGNPDSFFWDLGLNTGIITEFEPELPPYTTPQDSVSTYTITLVATNACGADTFAQEITVLPPDVTAFIQLDAQGGCQPLTLPAESFSTPGSELSWTIIGPGGNQVSGGTGGRPDVLLDQPGPHTVILTATGCGMDADTAFVEVLPAPDVRFSNLPTICLGDSLFFTNNSVGIGASAWDFGDGTTSADFSPVHVFDSAGTYTITYTGFSQVNNCPATITEEVQVLGLPVSAFGPSNSSGCPGLTVSFTNASSGVGNLRFNWNFGDGSNETAVENPNHTFHREGDFTVRMIAFDDAGCFSDTAFAQVTIFAPPNSRFTLADEELCLGSETLTATNTSGTASADWLIAGQPFAGQVATFEPISAGDFTIRQIVTNTAGCRDTSEQLFTVLPAPVAQAEADQTELCAGETVFFSASGTTNTTGLQWAFGDGTGATGALANQTYSVPGTYTVQLLASNDNGCPTDTATLSLTINPNPEASFTIDKPADCGAPAEVNLLNTSTGNLRNEWTFGNGTSGTERSPILVYDEAGVYPIELITISDFGCRDTARQTVDIFGLPVASAGASSLILCARDTLRLEATATQATSYEWYLAPDLQPRIGRTQTYVLSEAGTYSFNLIAIYNDQCRDTLPEPISVRIFSRPVADFEAAINESQAIIGDVRFINLSQGGDSFRWDLGDGTLSSEFDLSHEYDVNGPLDVTLIAAETNNGSLFCADTITKPVSPESIASFEVPDALSPDYGAPAVRVWGAVGSGITAYRLAVYSPYGELIWATESLSEDGQPNGRWDGTIGRVPVPQGTYSWEAAAKFEDGREVQQVGTVTVLR